MAFSPPWKIAITKWKAKVLLEKLSSGFKIKKFINYVLKIMLYPLNAISIFFIDMNYRCDNILAVWKLNRKIFIENG